MNRKVLFVGAGRRTEMARKWFFADYEVFSYELNINVPIYSIATVIPGFRFSDPDFYVDVVSTAERVGADLIIPFQDEAVYQLSRQKEKFINNIVISPPSTCFACYDKQTFESVFREKSYYPLTSFGDKISFIKPRFGCGGKGDVSETISQKFIKGTEYTVDCYFDKQHKLIDFVPRIRLRTFDGEVISSITVEPEIDLMGIIFDVGNTVNFSGPINMQFIKSEEESKYYLIEINARFGGGYTLSMQAGLNAIKLIERDYLGIDFAYKPLTWIRGLQVERALQDFYFRKEMS